jgi:hypothetical protein
MVWAWGPQSQPSRGNASRALERTYLPLRAVALLAISLLAGCQTFNGEPERLSPVADEVAFARDVALPAFEASYSTATTELERMAHRNEYVARRMYIIDLEYTEFETALTREREEFGFGSALAAQGLSTAGSVFKPAGTVRVLSALTSGANATRALYDSELLVNKTIQIVQSQMQAKRADVATRIFGRVKESTLTYSLSAALHDLEDYYRAGTLTTGLIKAAAEAGINAKDSETQKDAIIKQAAVIADVTKPLPPFRPSGNTSPNNLTVVETRLSNAEIKLMQTALCVKPPTEDFGQIDSPARKAVAEFFKAAGLGPSQKIENDAMRNLLNAAVFTVKATRNGTCASGHFDNAAAVAAATLQRIRH